MYYLHRHLPESRLVVEAPSVTQQAREVVFERTLMCGSFEFINHRSTGTLMNFLSLVVANLAAKHPPRKGFIAWDVRDARFTGWSAKTRRVVSRHVGLGDKESIQGVFSPGKKEQKSPPRAVLVAPPTPRVCVLTFTVITHGHEARNTYICLNIALF